MSDFNITEAQIDAALAAILEHGRASGHVPADYPLSDFLNGRPDIRQGMHRALRAARAVATVERGKGEGRHG